MIQEAGRSCAFSYHTRKCMDERRNALQAIDVQLAKLAITNESVRKIYQACRHIGALCIPSIAFIYKQK